VLYLRLIILSVGGNVPIDSEVLLVINFVNLKIKSTQSFRYALIDLTCVLYLRLIIFSVGGDVPIDSDVLLVIDFVNLKIKSTQSFRYVLIGVRCACMCS
jgi:hypothetical protein